MTTEIPTDYYQRLHQTGHAAVLLTVENKLSTEESVAVLKRVRGFLNDIDDGDDMRPAWLRFVDVASADVNFLVPLFCPTDKKVLSQLLIAVPEIKRHTLISQFDYMARQWPRKAIKNSRGGLSGRPQVLKREFHEPQNPNTLPLKLRFMACEAAMREAYTLGERMDDWPFFGFTKTEMKVWSEKLAREFDGRYPYLAEADRAIGGRLTRVISELGNHPDQPTFDRRSFWMCIRKGAVRHWEKQCDVFLKVISQRTGNAYKHYEEKVDVSNFDHCA